MEITPAMDPGQLSYFDENMKNVTDRIRRCLEGTMVVVQLHMNPSTNLCKHEA